MKMDKIIKSIVMFIFILILILFSTSGVSYANTSITVKFNYIMGPARTYNGFTNPTGSNIETTTGYINYGQSFTNVNNFAKVRGTTVQTSYYAGYYCHTLVRGGETITIYSGSDYLYADQPDFNFDYPGSLGVAVNYDNVPIKTIARAIGCDLVQYDSASRTVTVWDRLSDYHDVSWPGHFLVAGPWINGWSSMNPALSMNFRLKEFTCKDDPYRGYTVPSDERCGGEVKLALATLNAIQKTREQWGSPIYVSEPLNTSRGHRCWAEACVCTTPISNHLTGKALDISPANGDINTFQTWFSAHMNKLGWKGHEPYNLTKTWIHAQIVPWNSY